MRRLVVVAAAALLVGAPAAEAKSKLIAVSVCGPELCNIVRDEALVADLEALLRDGRQTVPAALEPFYGVDTVQAGGATGAGEFFPHASVLRWRPEGGEPRWLELPTRLAASLRTAGRGAEPYQPAITSATVDGAPVADPASYAHVFEGLHPARQPSRPTIPVALRWKAVGRSPWPRRLEYEPETDTLIADGDAARVSEQTASVIERDAGLVSTGGGASRWALAGGLAFVLVAGALAARSRRARATR